MNGAEWNGAKANGTKANGVKLNGAEWNGSKIENSEDHRTNCKNKNWSENWSGLGFRVEMFFRWNEKVR